VNVCLGTDSLASVKKSTPLELSMFEEMRAFSAAAPGLSPADLLKMATVSGARAYGLDGRAGEIASGAYADFITIPFSGPVSQVCEAVVRHTGYVQRSMIGGRWVYSADDAS
jgi:cytosine/adenosine deaminase-related metal-dependent hydrolase